MTRYTRRIIAFALAGVAIAFVSAIAVCASVYRAGAALFSVGIAWVASIAPERPASTGDPNDTAIAYQRARLIAASAYQARQDARHQPTAEHGVRWCPGT